jgi:hypothetical protein
MKPSDFQLGLIDFFAVLLPGTAAMWLLLYYLPPASACIMDPGLLSGRCDASKIEPTVRWAAFLSGSYLLGHFVFLASARLDDTYDRWRKIAKPKESDRCYEQASRLSSCLNPNLVGPNFSVLKWAQVYLQVVSPASRVEVDRLEASQKLFRSLVVVAVATAIHLVVHERTIAGALVAAACSVASFYRYCDQRWKMTELAYSSAVIVHASIEAKKPAAAKASDENVS